MEKRQFLLLGVLAALSGVVFYERANNGGTQRLGDALRSHMDGYFNTAPEEAIAAPVPATASAPTGQRQVVAQTREGGRSELGAHQANFASACSRPKTRDVSDVTENPIYKWTDARGKTHFSDKPPPKKLQSDRVDQRNKRQLYRLDINKFEVTLPTHFEGQMQAATNKIYEHYRDWLLEDDVRQAQISLSIYGDDESFEAYKKKVAPSLQAAAGFYSHRHNEAVVKYREPYRATQGTAIHEIAHLVTAGHLGSTAPWFTEGLSEYFEDFDIDASGARIQPNRRRLNALGNMLARGQLNALNAYLAAPHKEFHGEKERDHYMVSWSVLHFLQSNHQGQEVLAELVRATRRNFCKPFDARRWLYANYRGGYEQLSSDWQRWLMASV